MLEWKEDYVIGVSHIDEQHKHLFDIANRAFELLKDQVIFDKYDMILAILTELKEYTIYHFKSEEDYMQSIGYKKFFSQKVAHTDFLDKVNAIDITKIDNDQNEYLTEILDFVADWLVNHIIKEDLLITK